MNKDKYMTAGTDRNRRIKMKRKFLFMVAVLICGLVCNTCDLFKDVVKEPEVTLDSINFSEIDFEGLTLLSNVKVKNNMSVTIPFPNFDVDLHVLDIVDSLLQATIEADGSSLASNGSTIIKVPTKFTYAGLFELITALTDENKKENPMYKLNMIAHIPVPKFGDFSFPFEHKDKIPIMRIPDITVPTPPKFTNTGNLLNPGGKIDFSLNMKNKSNIDVIVKDLSCALKIGNYSLSRQGVTSKPRLNAGETGEIPFTFSLTKDDITAIGASILTGNISNFSLTGDYKFDIPAFPLISELGKSFTYP